MAEDWGKCDASGWKESGANRCTNVVAREEASCQEEKVRRDTSGIRARSQFKTLVDVQVNKTKGAEMRDNSNTINHIRKKRIYLKLMICVKC